MLPNPTGFLPVTVRGACSSLPCALGPLAPGEQRQVIATLAPPADYAAAPTVTVRAMAVSNPFDPRPENNAASVVTTIAEAAGLSITGLVTDGDGGPLSGIVVRLAGALTAETTTAVDGTYAFHGLPSAHDYSVTPVASGHLFIPRSRTFAGLTEDAQANFVGVLERYTRYYAEGATSDFFTTTFSVMNPHPTPANVMFRFQLPAGAEITHALTLGPDQHVTFDPSTIAGMASTPFGDDRHCRSAGRVEPDDVMGPIRRTARTRVRASARRGLRGTSRRARPCPVSSCTTCCRTRATRRRTSPSGTSRRPSEARRSSGPTSWRREAGTRSACTTTRPS